MTLAVMILSLVPQALLFTVLNGLWLGSFWHWESNRRFDAVVLVSLLLHVGLALYAATPSAFALICMALAATYGGIWFGLVKYARSMGW